MLLDPHTDFSGGIRWSGIPISLRIFHSVLWSTQSKALVSSIKQKQKIYTEELYKKIFTITHLEPDILEWEVKWALGSTTVNKASGSDGIPVDSFKSWKMMLWKCCTQYASKFGKLSSGHRTGKGQFSFQSQRKAMPKNAQTSTRFHSSHTLAK